MDNQDFVILYAPSGQTGETVLQFSSAPRVSVSNGSSVSYTIADNTITLNYALGSVEYVSVDLSGSTVILALMAKETASQWHAPVIPGEGTFGNYFSIGTNET